jgi:cyanophycinase-like exopeptidase
MIKVHRELLTGANHPLLIDTPFGFQANADDLSEKITEYFRDSVGASLSVARWRRRDDPVPERERSLSLLERTDYSFSGPGSPSYALHQWRDTPIPGALTGIVQRGGTVVMGSAAAVTVGSYAIPVYEIYKVGADPYWEQGLDLLGTLTGINAAVIPHYDNREGGRHDTRFCYLGESRLITMEAELPDGTGIFGVDEHTAVVIDIDAGTVHVHGAGSLNLRSEGETTVIPAGDFVELAEVAALITGKSATRSVRNRTDSATPRDQGDPIDRSSDAAPSLRDEALLARRSFDECIASGDADGALTACLELEDAIHKWSADTLQSDDIDVARRTLRAMIVDLAGAAVAGLRDDRETLGPLVDVALELRTLARTERNFAQSDLIRDRLSAAGIEVRDTPEGQTWELRAP